MGILENRVALVTGAGQGIGRGIAYALAAEGAALALVGRTEAKLKTTADEICSRGGHAITVVADITDPEQITAAVERSIAQLGDLDMLVNNAQEFNFGTLLDIDLDLVEAGWRSGAMATLRFMRAVHANLAGGGVIVNVSSGAVLDNNPKGIGAYAAVKAAIQSLSRAAAVEWAADGIRVNAVMPLARTPAVQASFDAFDGLEQRLIETIPLARLGEPENDIGRAVVFLCGPDAAYITGTTLVVDGGSQYLR